MGEFKFGSIDVSQSMRSAFKGKSVDSVVLLDKSTAKASYEGVPVVLVECALDQDSIRALDNFFCQCGMTRYRMVNALRICMDPRLIKKDGIIRFYRTNRSDYDKYIDEGAPVITFGGALYGFIQDDKIYPNYMRQIIFGVSSFWFSKDLTRENCHRVYPCESLEDIFPSKKTKEGFGINKAWNKGFRTSLAQIQVKKAIQDIGRERPAYAPLTKHFINTKQDFLDVFYLPNKDRHDEVLAWDLETSGLDFYTDTIGCITLSFDGQTGYFIDWSIMDDECKSLLGKVLANNRQCGANLKFDVKHLWKAGVPEARIDEDIIDLGHCLDETRGNSLKTLSYLYSEYGGYERELDRYKARYEKKSDINYLDIPQEILREYAVMDAIVTRRIWSALIEHMRKLDKEHPNTTTTDTLEKYYYEHCIPALNMYSEIEYTGVFVDKEKLDDCRKRIKEYINELVGKLDVMMGVKEYREYLRNAARRDDRIKPTFEWTSIVDVGKFLEYKGWEDLGRSKNGVYATADFQLVRWHEKHPAEVDLLTELRSMYTLLNTFIGTDLEEAWFADFVDDVEYESDKGWTRCLQYHKEDGSWRMHPDFKSMKADSGRSRCGEPNMQQIPTHSKWAADIKSCIKTPDDDKYFMVTVDYSALQLRLASIDTFEHDPLYEALQEPGVDLHSLTAWTVLTKGKNYGVETIEVEQDGRTRTYLGGQMVITQRGEIPAHELTEDDTIVNF